MARQFSYTAKLTRQGDGSWLVTFRDLPEALTDGDSIEDALHEAADCLEEAIAGRIDDGKDIPIPSKVRKGEHLVPLPAQMAAKAALYVAMMETGTTKSELARRLGCDVREARRLLDPRHPSKLPRLEQALMSVGQQLVVGMRRIASA